MQLIEKPVNLMFRYLSIFYLIQSKVGNLICSCTGCRATNFKMKIRPNPAVKRTRILRAAYLARYPS